MKSVAPLPWAVRKGAEQDVVFGISLYPRNNRVPFLTSQRVRYKLCGMGGIWEKRTWSYAMAIHRKIAKFYNK